jgi:hypothetical protein
MLNKMKENSKKHNLKDLGLKEELQNCSFFDHRY